MLKKPDILFFLAFVYGILVLGPQYFLENSIGRDFPPPINHPEYFYGFVGVGLAWQFVFLVIASDPPRYLWIILPGILEKLSFGIAAWILFFQGRTPVLLLVFATIDLIWAALFGRAFLTLRTSQRD